MDQNHSKRNKIADPSKGKLGLFFGAIFWEKFWAKMERFKGQIRGNQRLLIPYDEV
jgi:hypothetical protein